MNQNYGKQFHERPEEKPHIHPMQQTDMQNDTSKAPVDRTYKKGIIIGMLSATICFLVILEMILIFSRKGNDKPSSSTKQSQNTVNSTTANNSGKKYTIAIDSQDYPPFEYTDEDGNLVGIDVDILEAIADDQGVEYELKPLDWDAAFSAVENGQADGMISVNFTEERELTYDFSEPYYDICECIAVKDDSDIIGFEDLKGKKVGMMEDASPNAWEIASKYEYDIIYYTSDEFDKMYQDVFDGKLEAFLEEQPLVGYVISKGARLKIADVYRDDYNDSLSLVVLKGQNHELLDVFNAGLKNIKTNGKYDAIVEKYIQSK